MVKSLPLEAYSIRVIEKKGSANYYYFEV